MSKRRPLVANAADPGQVKRAARKDRDREQIFGAALQSVMRTPAGRLVLWSLLERAGVYASVFDLSGAVTAYKSGRQDFGHELLTLLVENDDDQYLLMEAEARQRARAEDRETAAAQTPTAEGE